MAADVGKSVFTVWTQLKYEHLLAGISGGILSTLVLHPLDLIKVRFQVNDGNVGRPRYQSIYDAFQSIIRQNGWRGLYQGVTPNIWGAGASWGFYFFFYNAIKAYMEDGRTGTLGPVNHMTAAAESGVMTLLITNPIWVTKTRLCLQYEGIGRNTTGKYNGMLDALAKIYKFEGVRGLYKGLVPGLFGVSHGALQFMAYEELKKIRSTFSSDPTSNQKLGSLEYIVCAALSKMFAVITTYPYQVVRSRLQDQHQSYDGVYDTIRQTFRRERFLGFYKGLVPNLLRVVPACCITFVVYEKVTSVLVP
ncbi:mitochondrial folate transporter/carrier-like [Asterias rubens]|uniref:mitochondrial folate transporter/carrier-like n=1 Tax=Asterias rubens TaxID=7604 RepID=UPI001454FBF0|nr:mitochondrial folate transporter/carrier-like [Asterias rubens]XP_033640453.1 mitochondrial folate transporter/carrier-like [Asterias rubens]